MSNQAGAIRQAPEENQRLASAGETAEYIADLLGQLDKMAQSAGFVRLQYLLRECVEEAEKLAVGA